MVRRPPEPQEVPRVRSEPLGDAIAAAVSDAIADADLDCPVVHSFADPAGIAHCNAVRAVLDAIADSVERSPDR